MVGDLARDRVGSATERVCEVRPFNRALSWAEGEAQGHESIAKEQKGTLWWRITVGSRLGLELSTVLNVITRYIIESYQFVCFKVQDTAY